MKVLEKLGEVCYNQTCVTARFRLVPKQRYAMKRKVADGASGNFRGVCPISNRATVNTEHSMCLCFLRGQVSALAWVRLSVSAVLESEKRLSFSDIFNEAGREHTAECKS